MAGAALVAVVWLLNPAFPVGASRLQTGIVVNPGESIQAAIDAANPGDTVIVQPGRYTESLTLNKPVSLTGVNSATTVIHAVANQRVLTVTGGVISNSVMISGLMFTGGVVSGTGAFSCLTYCGGGILIADTAQPLIQGVIVSDNYANSYGGGIYAYSGSPLTLRNTSVISNGSRLDASGVYLSEAATLIRTRIERNRDSSLSQFVNSRGLYAADNLTLSATELISNFGGGAYVGGDVFLIDSQLAGNYTTGEGGALYVEGTLIATGTEFISNTTTNGGGGALLLQSASVFTNVRFERNVSIANGGGAIYTFDPITLINTDFISNTAGDFSGGALYVDIPSAMTVITGGRFEGNRNLSWYGGGVHSFGTVVASGTEFINNVAYLDGGGLFAVNVVTLTNVRFERNASLSGYGGGLWTTTWLALTGTEFIRNMAALEGGGMSHYGVGTGRLINSLFVDNKVGIQGHGAGLAVRSVFSESHFTLLHVTIADADFNPKEAIAVFSGTVDITDSIIASHTIGISLTIGNAYEDYNLFFGNTTDLTGTVASGGHSFNGDPKFIAPENSDFYIKASSDAADAGIDAGINFDIDGQPRPLGAGFDIGYDEVPPDIPISGLNAVNNSPVRVGSNVLFTATIASGTGVLYRWNFGDGFIGGPSSNPTVAHLYTGYGLFTATVTATNSINTLSATTLARVEPYRAYLPVVLK